MLPVSEGEGVVALIDGGRAGRPARQVALTSAALTAFARRLRGDPLLRNSTYIMATTVLTSLLGYLYWILAARVYPIHAVGLAAALLSAMTLAALLADLGIGATLVQMLPSRASGRAWSATVTASVATGGMTGLLAGALVVVALPLVSGQFASIHGSAGYPAALICGVALWVLAMLVDDIFVAERAAGYMLLRNVAFALLKIGLLLAPLLLPGHAGALAIVGSWVLGTAVTALAALLLLPRLRRGSWVARRGLAAEMRGMVSSLLGHHFINLGALAPVYMLPLLVTARLSATQNAYYYTTWMLGSVFFMVSPAVAEALFVEGSHTASELGRTARRAALLVGSLLVPLMLIFLLGGRLILGLFGPAYAAQGLTLLLALTLSALPDAITNLYVSVLRVRRRLRTAAFLTLGMAALTLVLAWLLLPTMGIAGAGVAWLVAQAMGSALAGLDLLVARRGTAIEAVADAAHGGCEDVFAGASASRRSEP